MAMGNNRCNLLKYRHPASETVEVGLGSPNVTTILSKATGQGLPEEGFDMMETGG